MVTWLLRAFYLATLEYILIILCITYVFYSILTYIELQSVTRSTVDSLYKIKIQDWFIICGLYLAS